MFVAVVNVFQSHHHLFVDRYQRFSKEWNQVVRIRSVKAAYGFRK